MAFSLYNINIPGSSITFLRQQSQNMLGSTTIQKDIEAQKSKLIPMHPSASNIYQEEEKLFKKQMFDMPPNT